MKTIGIASTLALCAALSWGQAAVADQAMAQKNGCLACHAIENKLVGPSFKDISARYKGDAGAQATLTEKVLKGGVGNWGPIPMPANAAISEENAGALVIWILSL